MGRLLRLPVELPPGAQDEESVDREVDHLIELYGGAAGPDDLIQMARTLESWASWFPVGAERAKLWAQRLRERSSPS